MPLPTLPLTPYIDAERVRFFADGMTKNDVLTELATLTGEHAYVHDANAFTAAIFEREEVSSTGIGSGVAVPHAKLPTIDGIVISVGILDEAIDFGALDGNPVHVVLMIAACDRNRQEYLRLLATVAGILKQPQTVAKLRDMTDPAQVIELLNG